MNKEHLQSVDDSVKSKDAPSGLIVVGGIFSLIGLFNGLLFLFTDDVTAPYIAGSCFVLGGVLLLAGYLARKMGS